MKVFLTVILSLFLTLSAWAQEYADSGFTNKAEAKNLTVNGKKEGKWVTSDRSNTNIYQLTIYKVGKPYGMARGYFNDGILESELPYKNGKLNGNVKFYYPSGKLKEECPYTNSKENGIDKEYYESGKLESETPFKNGHMIGGGKMYYESGKIESVDKDTTINGEVYIAEKAYYEDGKIKSKTIWYTPADGDTKYYDESGNEIK